MWMESSFFLKFLHHYLYRVRHLLVEIKQQLLAYYLGDKESGRLVGQRILTEIWRSHGEQLDDAVHQRIGVKLQLGRCGEHLGVGKADPSSVPLSTPAHRCPSASQSC